MEFLNQILVAQGVQCQAEGLAVETDVGRILAPQFIDLRRHGLKVAMARYPITNRIYKSYMERTPSKELPYAVDPRFNGPRNPAVGLRESDAAAYCEWLSKRLSLDIVLPDASTWEDVARAGKDVRYATFDGTPDGDNMNFGLRWQGTTPVDRFPANAWGMHDMCGNVLEWTSSAPKFSEIRPELGAFPVETESDLRKQRILKGGCWAFDAANCAIASSAVMNRLLQYYTNGFRPMIRLEMAAGGN